VCEDGGQLNGGADQYALVAHPRKSFSSFVYVLGVKVNNLDAIVGSDDVVDRARRTHFVRRWATNTTNVGGNCFAFVDFSSD